MKMKLSREEIKEVYSRINLRQHRDEKCYSQEYISKQLGLSQSTYQRIESGEIKITAERLKKLAEILGKPVEAFFKDEKNADTATNKLITVSENEWKLMTNIILQQEKRIEELELKLSEKL
ncbi:MAG: XRE family transcriptional regulator [Flavobacterium sp.]|nr:MAG: XRE family transcriptional regulator [Flavobacterium sp.]